MAIEWGALSGKMYVGIDHSRSGSTGKVTVYVRTDSAGYDWTGSDSITVTLSGDLSKTWTLAPYMTGPYDSVKVGEVDFQTVWGKEYSWTAGATGLHTGGTPTKTRTYSAPDLPGKPPNPTISGVSASGYTLNWAYGTCGYYSCDYMQIQVDDSSGFGSPNSDYNDPASPAYPSNMAAYTTNYARVRAHNEIGWGPWSNTVSERTLAYAPSAPGTPSVSRITSSSVTLSWSDPSAWGGDNSSDFELQVDTNSDFSSPTPYTITNANSATVASLPPNTDYWARVRGVQRGR